MYQIYLDMVDNQPTRAKADAAMDLAGVDVAYFVVNDYWWKSDEVIENAKHEADEWFSLGDGQITIFRFTKGL
jgi:hypothetical protein